MKTLSTVSLLAATISTGMVAGLMADHFGTYRAGFTLLASMAGGASLFWLFAKRPALPSREVRVGR